MQTTQLQTPPESSRVDAQMPILFVDDEPRLLEGIARAMRSRFLIRTAAGGADALRLIESGEHYAVVVSDMRMPQMNGAELLANVRKLSPDTVRIILSGQADLPQTIAAVNEGNIFRFLSKPCSTENLQTALTAAVEQFRLVTAEKTLLQDTLSGAVHMLMDVLNVVAPPALAHAQRLQRIVNSLRFALRLPDNWQWPMAALLSQIGCVSLPKDTLAKVEAGQPLSDEEQQMVDSHPRMAAKMLESIPRFETIATIVASQNSRLTDADLFGDLCQHDVLSIGRTLLRAAIEFDDRMSDGSCRAAAIDAISNAKPRSLPAAVIDALKTLSDPGVSGGLRSIHLVDLAAGMILDEPLLTQRGMCLLPAGQEVTRSLLARLGGLDSGIAVKEPFRVRIHQ